jgi:hypothetical protein
MWAQARIFYICIAGLAAVAALGTFAFASAYAEEPCLGVVGETVESEVSFLNMLLSDPGAVVEDEINFVLGVAHDPFGTVHDDIETVQGDLESVQACLD